MGNSAAKYQPNRSPLQMFSRSNRSLGLNVQILVNIQLYLSERTSLPKCCAITVLRTELHVYMSWEKKWYFPPEPPLLARLICRFISLEPPWRLPIASVYVPPDILKMCDLVVIYEYIFTTWMSTLLNTVCGKICSILFSPEI